jgi:putative Mn2+ efflux pump MntP
VARNFLTILSLNMDSFLFNTFVLSLDSFVVAIALSPSVSTSGARWRMALLFGLCDGIAVLAGFALSQTGLFVHISENAAPLFSLVYGIYFLIAAQWKHFRVHSSLVYLLPAFMSLDNLAYGLKISSAASPDLPLQVAALGMASMTLASVGFFLGGLIHFTNARSSHLATGVALIAAALMLSVM